MIDNNYCRNFLLKADWNEKKARQELLLNKPLPSLYREMPSVTGSPPLYQRISVMAVRMFEVVIFPLFLFKAGMQLGHRFMGYYLIPACLKNRNHILRFVENWNLTTFLMTSIPVTVGLFPALSQVRAPQSKVLDWVLKSLGKRDLALGRKWQFQRFTITGAELNKIDAVFIAKRRDSGYFFNSERALSSRVLLYVCSQDELAEGKIHDMELGSLAKKLGADIVAWNPPGLGASEGNLSRSAMVKACRAVSQFAQSPLGLGAKEIIIYGHSLGAAIALEAHQHAEFPSSARHLFVLRSAFSTMQEQVASSISSWLGVGVRFWGWNMDNAKALSQLKAPALILQSAAVKDYQHLTDSSELIPDAVIEDPNASLARAFFKTDKTSAERKVVGVPRWHDEPLTDKQISLLAKDIVSMLK